MKFRVFGFRGDEYGDVGIRIFPKREEIVVSGSGFGRVALQNVCAGKAEMGECADGFVEHNSAMVEDFFKFSGGFVPLMGGQICLPAHVNGIQTERQTTLAFYS